MFKIFSIAVFILLTHQKNACESVFFFKTKSVYLKKLFLLASYEYDSNSPDIEELSEQLFRESEPNIFPYVKVNRQSSTTSWSRDDAADLP